MSVKQLQLVLPMTLSDEEVELKKMQEQLKELRKSLAEKKSVSSSDAPSVEKKGLKISLEEAEEATQLLKKKVQEGAVLVTRTERGSFKRVKRDRLVSDSVGEDGEILDDLCGSPPAVPLTPTSAPPFPPSSAPADNSR